MRRMLIFAIATLILSRSNLHADTKNANALTAANFTNFKKLIQPQPTEGLWRFIPWETSLTTARRKAAVAGKPLLIWAGGGSAPLGGC